MADDFITESMDKQIYRWRRFSPISSYRCTFHYKYGLFTWEVQDENGKRYIVTDDSPVLGDKLLPGHLPVIDETGTYRQVARKTLRKSRVYRLDAQMYRKQYRMIATAIRGAYRQFHDQENVQLAMDLLVNNLVALFEADNPGRFDRAKFMAACLNLEPDPDAPKPEEEQDEVERDGGAGEEPAK